MDFATGAGPRPVAIGGHECLLVANHGSNTLSLLRNHGDGTFGPTTDYPAYGPVSVTVGRFGCWDDVAVSNEGLGCVSVFMGAALPDSLYGMVNFPTEANGMPASPAQIVTYRVWLTYGPAPLMNDWGVFAARPRVLPRAAGGP